MARWRERFDAFPAQLTLTVLWATAGVYASFRYRESLLWIGLISVYAIVISHWTAHLAWRAKRAAQELDDGHVPTGNVHNHD